MKKYLSIILAVMLLVSLLTGCGGSGKEADPAKDGTTGGNAEGESTGKEVEVLMMIGSPTDPYAKFTHGRIEAFNAEFAGKYKMVTEFGGAQSMDRLEKMKMLNSSKNLPAIVTQLHEDTGFTQLLMDNNRLFDIKPYFDASEEWKEYAIPEHVNNIIKASGGDAMYTIPNVADNYIGLFYNKELLAKAGYEEFPSDWEGFWKLSEDLLAAGITPISMDTLESAWCSMLISTSVLADSQEGREFLETQFPTDFKNEHMVKVFDTLKRIFDSYTTADATGAPYATAANNFCSEQTAMIANGPWMIESFSDPEYAAEGFVDKVGYAPYPGQAMIVETGLVGAEAISMDVPLEVQEAAIEWYKFNARPENIKERTIAVGSFNPKVPVPEEELQESSGPVGIEYAKAIGKVKYTLPSYQTRWDAVTMYEVFAVELPNYVSGRITTDELLERMSESAAKYVEELEKNK